MPALRVVSDRGPGKDSAGRPLKEPPAFKRTIPEKPEGLGDAGSRLWDKVCAELPRLNLLKDLDAASLEMACQTLDRWATAVRMRLERGITAKGPQGESVAPWIRVEESASREFRAWCAEYGLTPASEMKLGKPSGDDDGSDDDPFGG